MRVRFGFLQGDKELTHLKVTPELRPKGNEEVNHTAIGGGQNSGPEHQVQKA